MPPSPSPVWLDLLHALRLVTRVHHAQIIVLGLDCAGKTTLLKRLENPIGGSFPPNTSPTFAPQSHRITLDNYDGVGTRLKVVAYDLGGSMGRHRWLKDYLPGVRGVVWVVDAADRERIEESKEELEQLLACLEKLEVGEMGETVMPVVVVGSKNEVEGAVGEEELRAMMGLDAVAKAEGELGREIGVFMCFAMQGTGCEEGFRWLARRLMSDSLDTKIPGGRWSFERLEQPWMTVFLGVTVVILAVASICNVS